MTPDLEKGDSENQNKSKEKDKKKEIKLVGMVRWSILGGGDE